MACRLIGAKPLFEPMTEYYQFNSEEQTWHFNRNSYVFIQENAFENIVCQKSANLSRPQYVNEILR